VSASSGDGSIHKAIQLLIQSMVERTLGLHRDSAIKAMKKKMAAELAVYGLDLTENQDVS